MSSTKKKNRIVLLDTHAILHRAYHALPDFTAPDGRPTGALYGLSAFLLKIFDDLAPDQLIAAYDLPDPTHRHEAFAAYKANREKTDDALVAQLIASREILDALSVPYIEVPGFEADDILGTLAERLKTDPNNEVLIASGDMDTLQLVDGTQVKVYTLKKGIQDTVIYDAPAVKERYGFGPEHISDYKGLRGDPSDNIPGIRGIGEKTATTLIAAFGGVEEIYTTLAQHPEKFATVGIKPRIITLLTEGEDDARFSKELATIRRDVPCTIPKYSIPWTQAIELAKVTAVFRELGFKSLTDRLVRKLGVSKEQQEVDVPAQEVMEESLSEDEQEEIRVAYWLLKSDSTHPTLEDVLEYAQTRSLKEARDKLFNELKKKELWTVFETIERPLIPIVQAIEARGILLDTTYLLTLSKEYHLELDMLAKKIHDLAGVEFNINSPKQLGEILFDTLKIGTGKGKKTATGQRSTREEELRKYENEEPIIAHILTYRELQKLLSTYIDNLPTMVDGEHRLHAHFSQTGATTGRMSSQSPNMQNIPIKTPKGFAIRRAVIAPKDYTLLSADYNQIELRVASFLSRDEKLITYFKNGLDAHTEVAAQVFEVAPDRVTPEMRRKAKVINFGILYGMGSQALALATGSTKPEAKKYLEAYFERFSGVAKYIEEVKQAVKREGYTKTLFGRRRYFEGVHSSLPYVVAQMERMAVNAPIQGTSADIMKLAMIRMDTRLKAEGYADSVFLIGQIHDELLYEVPTTQVQKIAEMVRVEMEGVLSLEETYGVPLLVDVEVGDNWGEMHAV